MNFRSSCKRLQVANESLSLVSDGGGVGKTHFIAMVLELETPLL